MCSRAPGRREPVPNGFHVRHAHEREQEASRAHRLVPRYVLEEEAARLRAGHAVPGDRGVRRRARQRGARAARRGRRDHAGAARPAQQAEVDRERELRLAGHAARDGQLVERQVLGGLARPPLLRGLRQRRRDREARAAARVRAVRRRPRLRAAAQRHRRQPGRVLERAHRAHREPDARAALRQGRGRALGRGLGGAAARARQPEDEWAWRSILAAT